eukprot:TRINITY_DN396_c0_g1_i5.p1 TRINITY_DN396_c0_g1~~TRINITY_DN396_c0_g1_i5.p1  ORF type:complete len:118 (-),score=13.96 TRINITY_DN396_c0_g1_i5:98-451(-)
MLSPFSRMRPSSFRVSFFLETSSASSRTRFMYSSNPMMRPSSLSSVFSYSQIWILCLFWRNRKMRLMGCVITFWYFCGPDMAIGSGSPVLCVDTCLLYTSDAADEEDSVDLGGRRIH